MEQKYLDNFKNEIENFKENTKKFYKKEISVKDYKGLSGKFGSYAQRGGKASMLRLRMGGGHVTKDKLKFVVDSINKYNIDKIHITTCQTIQFHNLSEATVCSLIDEAFENGIITMGGGGDFPRNVMVSPLTGVEECEYFDVYPYAEKAADYLIPFIEKVKLPRKLKVCFSNSKNNTTHATFRDLGFAANENGKFDVYSAGGLGNNPKMGICVAENINPNEILYYIKAMILMFISFGNYDNRAKARTRYMQDTLGKEKYIEEFNKKLEEAKKENLDIEVNEIKITKTGEEKEIKNQNIIKQKQKGLYVVKYHPIGGDIKPEKLKQLYETIKNMKDVEIRISPDETLYIINCTYSEAEEIINIIDDTAKNILEESVSCIGSTICQVGLRNSQGLLRAIIEKISQYNFRKDALPKIHISGCTSSCGTHQIGIIGFHGCTKMIDKIPNPAFTLHINGNDYQGNERFGDNGGAILEKDIPDFIYEVINEVSKTDMDFEKWINTKRDVFNNIAKKYTK